MLDVVVVNRIDNRITLNDGDENTCDRAIDVCRGVKLYFLADHIIVFGR